jgi:hypothetical protein
MVRYGVQFISKADGQVKWLAIGVGSSPDIQKAHLYTSYGLAKSKMKQQEKSMSNWCENFKIIPFDCTPRNSGVCSSRMNPSEVRESGDLIKRIIAEMKFDPRN